MTLITTAEAAEKLGVHRTRVQVLIRTGRLPALLIGGTYVIEEKDLALVADRRPGRPTQFAIFGPDYHKVSSELGWKGLTKEKKAAKLFAEVKKMDADRNTQRAIPEGRENEYMLRVIDAFEAKPARKAGTKKPAPKEAKKSKGGSK